MVFSFIKEQWNRRKAEKQRLADEADRAIWNFYHGYRTVDDIDAMSGSQFEEFIARLFKHMGYREIRLTSVNDQGGDLVCVSPAGCATVVQAKRWARPVGNSAVQEVLGAMRHYTCDKGFVITNSTFTEAAIRLAAGGEDVTLLDRQWLREKVEEFLPASVPDFDRAGFEQLVEDFVELTRQAANLSSSRRRKPPKSVSSLYEAFRFAGQAKGKPLSVSEIKSLAHIVIKVVASDKMLRDTERRLQEAEAHNKRLEEEIQEIDELLSETNHWQ